MKFKQLDAITELVPGEKISARRTLQPDASFLQDHFPFFPVLPGVLMLEGLYQAALWLVRKTDEFGQTMIMLEEVRNAKFNDFVAPGETLDIEVELIKREGTQVVLKATGTKNGNLAVSARLVLQIFPPGTLPGFSENAAKFSNRSVAEQWDSLYSGLAE